MTVITANVPPVNYRARFDSTHSRSFKGELLFIMLRRSGMACCEREEDNSRPELRSGKLMDLLKLDKCGAGGAPIIRGKSIGSCGRHTCSI